MFWDGMSDWMDDEVSKLELKRGEALLMVLVILVNTRQCVFEGAAGNCQRLTFFW